MNIVFEGINGSGKSTLINEFKLLLRKKDINFEYIADLEIDTPLKPILQMMLSKDIFLQMSKTFKTSLFESLTLAANHHYIQVMHRKNQGLTIYDRDFFSILSYQKDIIKKEYQDWEEFFTPFKQIIIYQLKDIDLLCYVKIPTQQNIQRTEKRDKRKFSKEHIVMLNKFKKNLESELTDYKKQTKVPFLTLDGSLPPTENVDILIAKILSILDDMSFKKLKVFKNK
jgi:thymidylate kinase